MSSFPVLEGLSGNILDVGGWGDGGVTSRFVASLFQEDSISYLNHNPDVISLWQDNFPRANWKAGVYPDDMCGTYDVIFLDAGIETNLAFWSPLGMEMGRNFLNENGVLITYVVCSDHLDFIHDDQIQQHWLEWWGRQDYSPKTVVKKLSKQEGWLIDLLWMESQEKLWIRLKRIETIE